jgi:ABC-type multidrug transport system permease subunit
VAIASLIVAAVYSVLILMLHSPGHDSVPMWIYWITDVLWLAVAVQAFRRAGRDRGRLTATGGVGS